MHDCAELLENPCISIRNLIEKLLYQFDTKADIMRVAVFQPLRRNPTNKDLTAP